MNTFLLDLLITSVLLGTCFLLIRTGLLRAEIAQRGWTFLVSGFVLLFAGSALGLTEYFSLFSLQLETVEAICMVAYLCGVLSISIGLLRWLPSITHVQAQSTSQGTQTIDEGKISFLSDFSHKIRTPLTSILGYVDVLNDSLRDRRNFESLEIIKRNGLELFKLVNDLRDYSKIEAGQLQLVKSSYKLPRLLQEVARYTDEKCKDKGLVCNVELSGKLPEEVEIDGLRLRQILMHLADNAVRYTQQGQVSLQIKVIEQKKNNAILKVVFIDTGIGISKKHIDVLFDPFSTNLNGDRKQSEKPGMRLALCKNLAQLLGGDIEVESQEEVGSAFHLSINLGDIAKSPRSKMSLLLEAPEKNISPQSEERPLTGTKVLIAEDGIDNQRLFLYLLKAAGAQVMVVDNGKLAVDLISNMTERDPKFDVILMDMEMPEMDGYQATELLRSQNYVGSIVALTANALPEQQARSMQSGCDYFLAKPVERSLFLETVAQAAGLLDEADTTEQTTVDV